MIDMRRLAILALVCNITSAHAETVDAKYRGPVDLKPFTCQSIMMSRFVNRVRYDPTNRYMVLLKDKY
ncbi:hypothetical protein XH97_05525 [Bradyrhizobium sp. CCBAU 53380]|nr:hypothetical protein [Bradyrhizobium sp. CCBAU 53380]